MSSSYFDVVVLGARLSSLLCAALLSKRGFRVLLLDQDEPIGAYEASGVRLPRAPFTLLTTHSPMTRRVLSELALLQTLRRKTSTPDSIMQVALPGHRMDLAVGAADLEQELEREFPEVKRPIEDFHRHVASASAELDRLLERDLVWPPETFLERREFARAVALQSFERNGEGPDLLSELPDEHPFRTAAQTPVRFTDGMDPDHPNAVRTTRLYAAWLREPTYIDGGEDALRALLIDKVESHGGQVRRRERCDRILVRRNHAKGVRIAGSGEEVGCAFVVAGVELTGALRLLEDRRPFEELFERIGEPQKRYFRYTVNLWMAAEGVPEGMGRDVFFVRRTSEPLYGANALHIQAHPAGTGDRRVLSVQALLPRRGIEDVHGYLEGIRGHILDSVRTLVPFLDEHLYLVDSPHDGQPIHDLENNQHHQPAEPWRRGPGTMQAIYGYPVTTALGVCALPIRTPVRRLLLCSEQVVPGLGEEGAFLAAWSAARLITRADRRKEWMRRGLWTKVEI